MKRILYLFAAFVAISTTAFATTTITTEADASIDNYVRGYGNSFIFNEAGIEFSVFADGQFDFYVPKYGPNVNVNINRPGFSLSFNTGYNYNPYVQYDSYGAIIQIENTPIYYDYYGRVNQIGNIFINYNSFGKISRLGGLNVYYRDNVFYRYDGFINIYNRSYVYKPWHRYYTVPHVNHCVVHVNPYRQFYTPVRHIYYRPYTNNVRHFNIRRGDNGYAVRRTTKAVRHVSYAQTPRNRAERNMRTTVRRNNAVIAKTRTARLGERNSNTARSSNATTRTNTNRISNRTTTKRSSTRVTTPTRRNNSINNRSITTRTSSRATTPKRTMSRGTATVSRSNNKNVTRSNTFVSNRTRTTSAIKPKATSSRVFNKTRSQNTSRSNRVQSKRKSSSVKARSTSSRTSNQSSKRSSSRRSKG